MDKELASTYLPGLRVCRLFRGIEDDSIIASVSSAECGFASFLSGEQIYKCGCENAMLGIILSGQADIYDGREKVLLNTLSQGAMFGAVSLFGNAEDFITVIRARGQVSVVCIKPGYAENMIVSDEIKAKNYIMFLSEKIRFLNKRIACFTGELSVRLYKQLASSSVNGIVEVKSFSALAKALGMGRSSLYRELDRLKSAGMISVSGGSIRLLEQESHDRM
ncbi:MAG: Crp/Fnr family transcriptional regulator [Oscillospiraceae bacterium]|nr:Crp/Fnr family transcriptional regulator [Oscillospiraceae bacterium]